VEQESNEMVPCDTCGRWYHVQCYLKELKLMVLDYEKAAECRACVDDTQREENAESDVIDLRHVSDSAPKPPSSPPPDDGIDTADSTLQPSAPSYAASALSSLASLFGAGKGRRGDAPALIPVSSKSSANVPAGFEVTPGPVVLGAAREPIETQPTRGKGNCLFHATFGDKTDRQGFVFSPQSDSMRTCFEDFLAFYASVDDFHDPYVRAGALASIKCWFDGLL
jgi:hypothetical protein